MLGRLGTMNVVRNMLAGCAMTAVVVAGCSKDDGPERVVVSGTVTYKGKPIPDGTIRFVPGSASAASATGASIVNGKYTVSGRGGVPVGTYSVQVEAYCNYSETSPPSDAVFQPPKKFELRRQYIPEKFNSASKLQFAVPSGSQPLTGDFNLTD
jgi:hypothetical protein